MGRILWIFYLDSMIQLLGIAKDILTSSDMVGSPSMFWYSKTPIYRTSALWLSVGMTGPLLWCSIYVNPIHLECDPVGNN